MKKFLFLLSALSLLFVAPVSFAQDTDKQDRQVLASNETVDKDYFATAGEVEISGTVNGDVYAFGGKVLVDGKVNGDLIAAGGTVNISGEVTQDVRVAGGQITVSGRVGRNITIGGGNVDLTDAARVEGSVVAGGGNITLAAPVGKGITVGGGNITIANSVGGDIRAGTANLRLTSKANVNGSVTYWSQNKISIDQNAKVSGSVTQKIPPEQARIDPERVASFFAGMNLLLKIITWVSLLILGFILIRFFPGLVEETVVTLSKRPLASVGLGFLALILTPIVSILLLFVFPLAFMLFGLYLISLFLARVFAIVWLGSFLLQSTNRPQNPYLTFLIGLFAYAVLTFIPIVGGVVGFLTMVFGLGAFLIALRKFYSGSTVAISK